MSRTIREEAEAYEPPKTKNIADLDVVPADAKIEHKEYSKKGEDGQTEKFSLDVIVKDGEDYRVPVSVIKALKIILKEKPLLKFFKVVKSGTGRNDTTYTVIPLE